MNATKQELKTINNLLDGLNASNILRSNIFKILESYSNILEIFANTIINGLEISLELKKGSKNILFISPMQSGKSGSIFFLNYVLTEIGFLKYGQSVLFLTSMRDKDLYEQNIANLQKQYFDIASNEHKDSNIHVYKIDDIFKYPNPFEVLKQKNVVLFIRDEDQFGSKIDSTFDCGFFQELRKQLPHMPLISISATPFDLMDANFKGYPVNAIKGQVPSSYMGINEMINLGLVENIDDNFTPFVSRSDSSGRTIIEISKKLDEYVQHLITFVDGIGIIRVSNSDEAFTLRKVARNKYKTTLKTIVVGSDSGCDFNIADGMRHVKTMVNSQRSRVLLIVVNALSAGKDFKLLKEKIRFGIETRKTQLANGAQGIPGRICGYHTNRNFKILACLPLLKKYVEFENDWTVINDPNWRNDLQNIGIRNLSTQVKLEKTRKGGEFTPIINDPLKLSIAELKTVSGRKHLHFLDQSAFNKLLSAFKYETWHDENSFRLKSSKSKTTIRVASNYNKNDNRVYKLWDKLKKDDDFGSVMFKKKAYDWGILISNIPINKTSISGIKNELDFVGIEIYQAGVKTMITSVTATDNHSMYSIN